MSRSIDNCIPNMFIVCGTRYMHVYPLRLQPPLHLPSSVASSRSLASTQGNREGVCQTNILARHPYALTSPLFAHEGSVCSCDVLRARAQDWLRLDRPTDLKNKFNHDVGVGACFTKRVSRKMPLHTQNPSDPSLPCCAHMSHVSD